MELLIEKALLKAAPHIEENFRSQLEAVCKRFSQYMELQGGMRVTVTKAPKRRLYGMDRS